MDFFKRSLATLTGGSGAVAVLLTDGSLSASKGRRLLGWGDSDGAPASRALPLGHRGDRAGLIIGRFHQFTSTDAASVLTHGVELGKQTWRDFSRRLGWVDGQVDKVICHQVGSSHRETILKIARRSRNPRIFPPSPIWATWARSRCR